MVRGVRMVKPHCRNTDRYLESLFLSELSKTECNGNTIAAIEALNSSFIPGAPPDQFSI